MIYIKVNFRTLRLKDLKHPSQLTRTVEWIHIRSKILEKYQECMKCGSKADLQIDHIRPISKFPREGLNYRNLQVLCKTCNQVKSNVDMTRYIKRKETGQIHRIFIENNYLSLKLRYLFALDQENLLIMFRGKKTSFEKYKKEHLGKKLKIHMKMRQKRIDVRNKKIEEIKAQNPKRPSVILRKAASLAK